MINYAKDTIKQLFLNTVTTDILPQSFCISNFESNDHWPLFVESAEYARIISNLISGFRL